MWEYVHTPYLTETLSMLNQSESDQLGNEIFDWDDFHLYWIADPIIFCSNRYFNATLLYIKIFIKIEDMEYLEYLVENDIPYILPDYYTQHKLAQLSPDLITRLKQNILRVMSVKSDSWNVKLRAVIEFLDSLKTI